MDTIVVQYMYVVHVVGWWENIGDCKHMVYRFTTTYAISAYHTHPENS